MKSGIWSHDLVSQVTTYHGDEFRIVVPREKKLNIKE
jgi:hypothetical protein